MSSPQASEALTVAREKWGIFEWIVNFVCWLAVVLRLPLASLDAGSVQRAAERSSGLSDLGNPASLEGMRQMLGDVEQRRETALSRVYFRQYCRRALVNRFRIEDALSKQPGIREIPIERPIFVLGFPRTGTTLIQNLLTLEQGRRSLKFWELTCPAPLLDDPERDRAKRIKICEQDLYWAFKVCPEMPVIHDVRSTTAEECWPLLSVSFAALNTDISQGLRGYGSWLLEQDTDWVYKEYKERLQLLLSQTPADQLVLKCPEHLWFLDSLLETFPDACIVWTHRNPLDCIASYCSMVSLNLRLVWAGYDARTLGEHISHRFHQGVSRAMAVRKRVGDERFFDVRFDDLVKDPLAVVEKAHAHFELPCSDGGRQAMQDFLGSDRKDSRGKHRYDAARYGLTDDGVRERFSEYLDHFGIS